MDTNGFAYRLRTETQQVEFFSASAGETVVEPFVSIVILSLRSVVVERNSAVEEGVAEDLGDVEGLDGGAGFFG